MFTIVVGILAGLYGSFVLIFIVEALKSLFSSDRKSALLTGPVSSGKTTFLRYISKENIPDVPSGSPKTYEVEDALFDKVTDLSGAEEWLVKSFDIYLKDHDYVLFFFDVSEYTKDEHYRDKVNARVDFIHNYKKSGQIKLMVGTHIDKAPINYKSEIEKCFAGKPYQNMLKKAVYIDTTKTECVEKVHKALEN